MCQSRTNNSQVIARCRSSCLSSDIRSALLAATRPFTRDAWLMIISVAICFSLVICVVAVCRPISIFGKRIYA